MFIPLASIHEQGSIKPALPCVSSFLPLRAQTTRGARCSQSNVSRPARRGRQVARERPHPPTMRQEGLDESPGHAEAPAGASAVKIKEEAKSVSCELRDRKAASLEHLIKEGTKKLLSRVLDSLVLKFQKDPTMLGALSIVRESVENTIGPITPAPEVDIIKVQRKYKLVFNHECLALGCMEPKCDLCEANPLRRCHSDFDKKYFKGDILKAKCGGSIYIELVDAETEQRVIHPVLDQPIAMSILDGNRYDHLFPHAPPQCGAKELEMCALLTANEGRPLLQSQDRTANKSDGQIVVTLQKGMAMLPDLSVQYSSEALLSGRRPPFRLLVQLDISGHHNKVVIPAVSDGFVVASGRSRLAQKKHIPSVDDPVSRLENMGKERVKKLRDLCGTACLMGVDLPEGQHWSIIKVGDFRRLALNADKDGQLRQKMLHILKMSEKAWDETRDHALMAVTNDTRMRAWHKKSSANVGLVYSCYLGEIDLGRAVALIEGDEIHLKEHLTPDQRDLVRTLQKEACDCWWMPGHPGWTFYPFDSESFKQSPSLLAASKRDYGKTVSVEISRQDPSMVQFSKSEALPGRPLVAVLHSTPLSSAGRGEDTAVDREEFGEPKKRTQGDRSKSQGSQRKIQSPFEEGERQRSILRMVSSFTSHSRTSDKYVPRQCIPESLNSSPLAHRDVPENESIGFQISTGKYSKNSKEPKCQVSSGFETQQRALRKQFDDIFLGGRNPDAVPVDEIEFTWTEQKTNQELKDPRQVSPFFWPPRNPSKILPTGTSGFQGLSTCIVSNEGSNEVHLDGKVGKADNPSLKPERLGSRFPIVSEPIRKKRRHNWPSSRSMDLAHEAPESNVTDSLDETNVSGIARAPKRLRSLVGYDRLRAGQSLEMPPSLSKC